MLNIQPMRTLKLASKRNLNMMRNSTSHVSSNICHLIMIVLLIGTNPLMIIFLFFLFFNKCIIYYIHLNKLSTTKTRD